MSDVARLYRCRVCRCLWRRFPDCWSMFPGETCGPCCDNPPPGEFDANVTLFVELTDAGEPQKEGT